MKKILVSSLLVSVLFLISCTGSDSNKAAATNQLIGQNLAPGVVKLPNKQVCMVNDRFMNKDQIPVPVNQRIYYGCCEGCVTKLQNDTSSRYALDALTFQKVDKADAVIVLKPNTTDNVLYFASEANAIAYLKNIITK